MTPDEALAKLKALRDGPWDHRVDEPPSEDSHIVADGVLCDLLESLGHDEIVSVYGDIPKWYA